MVETVCGALPMEDMNFFIMCPLNAWKPNMPPNTKPAKTSMITIRFVIVAVSVLTAACWSHISLFVYP